jgi:hypothetical protein
MSYGASKLLNIVKRNKKLNNNKDAVVIFIFL